MKHNERKIQILEIFHTVGKEMTSNEVFEHIPNFISIECLRMLLLRYHRFNLLHRKRVKKGSRKRKYTLTKEGEKRLFYLKELEAIKFLKEKGSKI